MGGGTGAAINCSASARPSIPGMRRSVKITVGALLEGKGSESISYAEANVRAR